MQKGTQQYPNAREVEQEIADFLSRRFGGRVKLAGPIVLPEAAAEDDDGETVAPPPPVAFDMKPETLIAYLDQYIIRQNAAKAVLATKICTHFNRIRRTMEAGDTENALVGAIKNNILMIGPTGVGKTYMIKLIARRLGVPFVKGDATKFSETGYVGGDVEDLVRDLVREADDDIDRAQYGIIYIDEIDKIAGARNLIGADVSRTGVQRALLKPMEETEVALKVPHDPVSMLQEIDRFRKTGARQRQTINTRNILFIMSGAFSGLEEIITRRLSSNTIGFNTPARPPSDAGRLLEKVTTEDLIDYGFESEFVGRLPVRTVFETLDASDLYHILKNPNNPIILGKKLDFSAYGIDVAFAGDALRHLATLAADERTGARGLISAVEAALLDFERRLPSTRIRHLPVTRDVLTSAKGAEDIKRKADGGTLVAQFDALREEEKEDILAYVKENAHSLSSAHALSLTEARCDIVAAYYARHVVDIGQAMKQVARCYDEVNDLGFAFLKKHDINIVLEEDAADALVARHVMDGDALADIYDKLIENVVHGLKLVMQRTGRQRFFLSREALEAPEAYVRRLIQHGAEAEISSASDFSLTFSKTGGD